MPLCLKLKYFAGYRYELFCLIKHAQTPHCLVSIRDASSWKYPRLSHWSQNPVLNSASFFLQVYCLTSDEVSSSWNLGRDAAEQYSQGLWARGPRLSYASFPVCHAICFFVMFSFVLWCYVVASTLWCWGLKLQTRGTGGTALSSPSWKMTRFHTKPFLTPSSKEKRRRRISLHKV